MFTVVFLVIITLLLLGLIRLCHNIYLVKYKTDRPCCEWNGGEPCPYIVDISPRGVRLREGSLKCCKIRQTRIKTAKMIIDGLATTQGDRIIHSSRNALKRHRAHYPREHEYLFGDSTRNNIDTDMSE